MPRSAKRVVSIVLCHNVLRVCSPYFRRARCVSGCLFTCVDVMYGINVTYDRSVVIQMRYASSSSHAVSVEVSYKTNITNRQWTN